MSAPIGTPLDERPTEFTGFPETTNKRRPARSDAIIEPKRGVLGARFDEASSSATISEIIAGSSAEEAGLQIGDVILSINSKNVAGISDVGKVLESTSPGDDVVIEYQRGPETRRASAKLKGMADTVAPQAGR